MMSAICPKLSMPKHGEKIEERLRQLGKTPRWLSLQLKVSPQTVLNWIDGGRPQKDAMWTKLAATLSVPRQNLEYDDYDLPTLGAPKYPVAEEEVDLPLWPSLPANENWEWDPADCITFKPVPGFLARKSPKDPERIVAGIEGSSMLPRLGPGDLIVIELTKVVRTGRLVLARSEKGRTIKVLRRGSAGGYELHSVNPAHGHAEAAQWEIEGYVVAILRDYERGRGLIEWDDAGLGP